MKVYVAEKPQLGRAIADVLSDLKGVSQVKRPGCIEVGDEVVTWAFGHLMELPMPEEVDPEYKKWTIEQLPLQLPDLKPVVKPTAKEQFSRIQKLIARASCVVHAGDPDDEGQCLIDEVLEECHYQGKVLRLLISDMNPGAVQKELGRMKDNTLFQSLRNKGKARSYSDYHYGLNMTRYYTVNAREKGGSITLTVGRCQTPILGIVVQREIDIANFVPQDFFKIVLYLKLGEHEIAAELVPPDDAPVDDKGRITDKSYTEAIIGRLTGNATKNAVVQGIEAEVVKQAPPKLFSLLPLQSHMSRVYDINPEDTMKITQTLRLDHNAITYNRTDCKYASDEQFAAAADTLVTIGSANLPGFADLLAGADATIKSRSFNDKKVTVHTAIIPVVTNLGQLTDKEKLVYTEISRQYVAQFYPPRVKDTRVITMDVDGLAFVSRLSRISDKGWEKVLKADADEENFACEIPAQLFEAVDALTQGMILPYSSCNLSEGKTTPPEPFTLASLLDELPRIANHIKDPDIRARFKKRDDNKDGDNKGIGTPATRGDMLKSLIDRGYIALRKKRLVATDLGKAFFNALPAIATSPDITAIWGEEQDLIGEGKLTFEEHMEHVHSFILEQVSGARPDLNVKTHDCPECGRPLRRIKGSNGYFWGCSGYNADPQCKKSFPDVRGKPQLVKPEPAAQPKCPHCSRPLKRIPDKKNPGKFFWACEGVWDKEKPCRTFLNDKGGKPVADKKGKK
ncbi:TPA: DNA topoisomerase [Klebsiella aerogenes]